jgi:hypothetical protein
MIALKFISLYLVFSSTLRKIFNISDVSRWSDINNLSPEWDERTIIMARLVPENSNVLEFGAGRLVLQDHIPASCRYTPSDLCDRGQGTIICDLNKRPLPDFIGHDVLVFSGVLEYIHDVPSLIENFSGNCKIIIASYVCATGKSVFSILRRRRASWVNDYSSVELKGIFCSYGFICSKEIVYNNNQIIYAFEKI